MSDDNLNEQTQKDYLLAIRDGRMRAASRYHNQLVTANMKLLEWATGKAMRRWGVPPEQYDDAYGSASVGFVKACQTWEPERYALSTWVTWKVEDEVRRWWERSSGHGGSARSKRIWNRFKRLETEMTGLGGNKPTAEELVEEAAKRYTETFTLEQYEHAQTLFKPAVAYDSALHDYSAGVFSADESVNSLREIADHAKKRYPGYGDAIDIVLMLHGLHPDYPDKPFTKSCLETRFDGDIDEAYLQGKRCLGAVVNELAAR